MGEIVPMAGGVEAAILTSGATGCTGGGVGCTWGGAVCTRRGAGCAGGAAVADLVGVPVAEL